MKSEKTTCQQTIVLQNAVAEVFHYAGGGEVEEYHVMLHISDPSLPFREQLDGILAAYGQLRREHLHGAEAVFKRYFVSDAANQYDDIVAAALERSDCALSVVQQPPLDGTKIALWAYLQTHVQTQPTHSGLYAVSHGSYRHLWNGGAAVEAENSEYQTRLLLNQYILQLIEEGCTLSANCIRTWFFVNDIDNNYAGVVKARNEVFYTQDMTDKTHFIASTGIGGRGANHQVQALLDTYAVAGIQPAQVGYLYALDHLNRTSEYGVSFERGTTVDYGDRRHVFISGTASIDHHGDILHTGDITGQTHRMWENVEALLREADMDFDDIGQMIVYLRDTADYGIVKQLFADRFPNKPAVIVLAPVCRPGWLIEMECMGVKAIHQPAFPNY